MPLRLKSLELHGYKTFASKTVFEFADGITAIVGPNGSGKSNFADSLRWVLGEQSATLLRAKKTEDMIFSGSEHRPRAGMASVTITFDNSTGWLPVDFSEVAITRRAYRDGRNEYLLNGQTVRLRDINELLAQSGLSERTYTILGQGMVDASLALKADERRRLFEEAAGIGLYRARREEALRRMENTQRNLERVLDILAELEPRLRGLERQAKRAQEYQQLQADLKLILREWYGYHWHRAQKELMEAQAFVRQQEARLHEARETYRSLTEGFASTRSRLLNLRAQLNDWHRQSAGLHNRREAISRDLAVLEERRRSLTEGRANAVTEQQRLADEQHAAEERVQEARAELERIQSETAEAKAQEAAAKATLAARQMERAGVEQKLNAVRNQMNDLSTRRARQQARLHELKNRIDALRQKLRDADVVIATAEQTFVAAEKKYLAAQKNRQEAETTLQQAENDLTKVRQRLSELETTRRAKQDERSLKAGEQVRLQARLDVLELAEKSLAGYAEGARFLLDAARQSKWNGLKGALSAVMEVPAAYEVALAAALGDAFDVLLLESEASVEQALDLLEQSAGRAVLLPLSTQQERAYINQLELLKREGASSILGCAAELVRVSAEFQPAVEALLGDVAVVEDRGKARQLRAQYPLVRFVTLKGEVFRPDGLIAAGRETRAAALSRPREKRELTEQLAQVLGELNVLAETLTNLNTEMAFVQKEIAGREEALRKVRKALNDAAQAEQQAALALESARRQRDFQTGQKDALQKEIREAEREQTETTLMLEDVEERLGVAQESLRKLNGELAGLSLEEPLAQVNYWAARVSVSERTVNDARTRLNERMQALERIQKQIQTAQQREREVETALVNLEAQQERLQADEQVLHQQIEVLRAQIEPAEAQLTQAEQEEAALQERELAAQKSLATVERFNAQAQLELARKQEALETLRRRIEEDFGLVQFEYETNVTGAVPLPLGEMVETLPYITELAPELEEALTQKRAQIRRMGAVNMEAQQEYESVKERYDFMTSQVADLRQAEADLRQVIAELDELTRKEFTKTFEAVAAEFKAIFTRLFGGGSARLVLTDPENLTETGIDIEARLPGRREQGLSLLSGGERSLTAISLVFALLKVSPTPVCVMDEVDAMLDEANVGRFRDLLDELSQHTQFIVVTHNRNTVQVADVIYGITMGRDSASQQISLRLDEVSDEMLGRA
ncbi:MAG: chromosome segregation protein SMC [Anaerolineae bacterium]|nr:MAG: chromosome segregation protein SMC [Anaerolineae bacterium]